VVSSIAGGGLFVDLASHTLDLLIFYWARSHAPRAAQAIRRGQYQAEDIVTGHFDFQSGVHGSGTWCFTTGDHVDRVEIVGSRGRSASPRLPTSRSR